NPARVFGNQFTESIRPFDDRDTVAEKILVQTEPLGGRSIFDPKKIEMIDRKPTPGVFVNERESRAGGWRHRSQTGSETFRKLGFAASEVAGECEDVAGFDNPCKLMAKGFGFGCTIGNERNHGEEVES